MPESKPQNPLEYATPTIPPEQAHHVVLGALGSCVVVIATVFLGIFGGVANENGAAMLIIPGVLVTLCTTAIVIRKSRYRGFSKGIWLGLGLAALIEGTCFIATR